jgi:hypothetical protein
MAIAQKKLLGIKQNEQFSLEIFDPHTLEFNFSKKINN